jgi:hypothetical protein
MIVTTSIPARVTQRARRTFSQATCEESLPTFTAQRSTGSRDHQRCIRCPMKEASSSGACTRHEDPLFSFPPRCPQTIGRATPGNGGGSPNLPPFLNSATRSAPYGRSDPYRKEANRRRRLMHGRSPASPSPSLLCAATMTTFLLAKVITEPRQIRMPKRRTRNPLFQHLRASRPPTHRAPRSWKRLQKRTQRLSRISLVQPIS